MARKGGSGIPWISSIDLQSKHRLLAVESLASGAGREIFTRLSWTRGMAWALEWS